MRRNDNFLDVERLHSVPKRQPVHTIPVADQVARRFSIAECLNDLLRRPGGRRMFRHVEVHDPAAVMRKHDQDKQDPKRRRRRREEVNRRDISGLQLRPPEGWTYSDANRMGCLSSVSTAA